jgi:hypothetical protein
MPRRRPPPRESGISDAGDEKRAQRTAFGAIARWTCPDVHQHVVYAILGVFAFVKHVVGDFI